MSRTTPRRRLALALLAFGATVAGLPVAGAATSAAATATVSSASAQPTSWNDGRSDQDEIFDCALQTTGTGMRADAGWGTLDGQVPDVGEVFYVRGHIGSISLPCSGETAVLPEVVPPAGLEFADDAAPVFWSLGTIGEPQQWSTRTLSFGRGAHGGYLIGTPEGEPWVMRQTQLLEIQVPVRATRPMKGIATQRPECQDRIDGDAPCPVEESGDHFQFAFTLAGSGSDRHYVIPYVGLFAGSGSGPVGPGGPGTPAAASASSTTASYQVSARRAGRATAVVRSRTAPTGAVVVRDGNRVVGRGTVGASGRATVRLPRLTRGVHRLSVRYAGSRTVRPSASPVTRVRVR